MGTARTENPARKRLVLSEEVEAVPVERVVCRSDSKHASNNRIKRDYTTKNRAI